MTAKNLLVELFVEELPDRTAQDALVLLFDVCEILELAPATLEQLFGPAALMWVTGLVYGQTMPVGHREEGSRE